VSGISNKKLCCDRFSPVSRTLAILANAAAIVFGHNHPSGDPQPSPGGWALTLPPPKASTRVRGCRVSCLQADSLQHCFTLALSDCVQIGHNFLLYPTVCRQSAQTSRIVSRSLNPPSQKPPFYRQMRLITFRDILTKPTFWRHTVGCQLPTGIRRGFHL
jgi:RadC-like JAB domain